DVNETIGPIIELPQRQRRIIVGPTSDGIRLTLPGKALAAAIWEHLIHVVLMLAVCCAGALFLVAALNSIEFSWVSLLWLVPLIPFVLYKIGVIFAVRTEMRTVTIEVAAG